MQRQLRVRRYGSRTKFEGYQLLQEKRWWGWKDLDREEIPSHVLISLGALGYNDGWVSKFAVLGSFGAGSDIIKPNPDSITLEAFLAAA